MDELEEFENEPDGDEDDEILDEEPTGSHHALKKNDEHTEDVRSLMRHIVTENRYGDLVSDDEIGLDPVALARQIQEGGSW